jgi:hypothetical protein
MTRNFGVTSGAAPGDEPRPRSQGSKYALPQHSIITRELSQPSFDERELGASVLFGALLVSPFLIIGALIVGYLAFVA